MLHRPNSFQILFLQFFLFSSLFLSLTGLQAQDWQEILDTTATDGAASDRYGFSVSISGSYAVVGAFLEDEDENGLNTMSGAGAAYILEKVGESWTEVQKIVSSDRAADDYFGISVHISGDYLVVGAQNEDEDASGLNTLNGAGSAYVFERSGGTWSEVQKIVPTNRYGSDEFGGKVSISGDYLIVGARDHYYDESEANTRLQAGTAYIFERDGGGSWNQVKKLVASDRNSYDFFGGSVAISGDYAVVGALYEDEDAAGANTVAGAGSVYFFERDGGGTWSQVQKVVTSDRAADDYFGWSVAISGEYAVVGARQEDEDAAGLNTRSNAGSAYVIERSGGGTWSQVQKITPSDRFSQDFTGESVAIDGDHILISSRYHDYDSEGANYLTGAGAAFLFERDGGGTWSEIQKIVPENRVSNSNFGTCGISNGAAIVGADQASSSQGRAYLFEYPIFPHGGYALDFDGTDDYVEIPHNASFNIGGGDFSFEAWIKASGSGTITTLLDKDDIAGTGLEVHQTAADKVNFYVAKSGVGNNNITSLASIGSGWTHVAVTRSGNLLSIYMNGKLDNTVTSTAVNFDNTAVVTLGANKVTGPSISYHFGGAIDEVRFWNDARTQAEIQANMHKELTGNEANLVAYYDMSNSSGTSLTDHSSSGNTGTLTNGPVWKTSGAHAGPSMGLDFDGSDDCVVFSGSPSYGTDLTWEAWIKLSANPFVDEIIGMDGTVSSHIAEFRIYDDKLEFLTNDGAFGIVTGTTDMTDNVWHHVAIVKSGTAGTLYLDGEVEATGTVLASLTLNHMVIGNLYLSGSPFGGDYEFGGNIDEVRIWSTARTEAQLRANKDRALDGDEAGLEAYYRFDQQADAGNTTLYDQTANGHHGTLTNMAPASDWVSSNPFNTWIGSDDSDWNNGDNWSSGSVPASSQDVGIFGWSGSNAPASANITGRNVYVASDASLSHSGNLTLSGDYYNAGTFTTTGNVTFSGSEAQTIRGTGITTFGTLTLNNSSGLTLATDLGVTSDLALTSGVVNLGGQTLTLGSSASVSGSPADGNHVNATSGTFRKSYSATGSFAFPVGDATLYSPITLNFTSGTFSSAYADVDLTVAKHPENISTGHYLSRYWTVSSSGISAFSCDVSATYVDGDITGTESELHGGKWDGSAWLDLGSATPASNLITGTVSGFSDFTGGQPYAFPVEWLNFSAKPEANSVLLDWTTASEQNSDFFAIERSGNLEQWEELGTQAAAGNSSYQLDYQYEDQQPLAGTAWYRLRQVDLDGSFQYSATLAIHFAGAGIVVYPNPVKDKLTIEVPSGQQLSVELINLQGQQIWQQQLTDGVQQLSLSELPSGLYTLRMRTEQNGETSYQIVKQ